MSCDRLFQFEQEFAGDLRCIPMAVRFKLDLVGIKLSLRQWNKMDAARRAQLLQFPGTDAGSLGDFDGLFCQAIALQGEVLVRQTVETCPQWSEQGATPAQVARFAREVGLSPPTADQWRGLDALQRFTLVKLSRGKHDNVSFLPALQEFGIA